MMRSLALVLGSSALTLGLVWLWSEQHTAGPTAKQAPAPTAPPPAMIAPPMPSPTLPERMSLTVRGEPLLVALDRLAALAHVGLAIHRNAQQLVREEADIQLQEQPWKQVEEALMRHGVQVRIEDGALQVREWGTEGTARLQRILYSTATMATAIEPHAGPRLGVQRLPDSPVAAEPVFGHGRDQDLAPELVEEVQSVIGPESWSNEGVAIETYSGSMVVRQTPEVHTDIQRFLATREQRAARQVMVRFHRLATPPAETRTILDAAAWAMLAKDVKPDAALLVVDGKRNHHFSGVRHAYVAADIFENRLGSPVMGMSTSGLMLEVEPHITVEGISTRIRLQATVSESMTTSPVKDATGRLLFDIDLPDQRIDQADDVRLIPPGGAALYRFDERTYAVSVEALVP